MPNVTVAPIKTDHKTTMKIYQIAGKQYAASGDDLYEQVPEFSPLQQLIASEPATPELPLRKKYKTKGPKKAEPKKKAKGGHKAQTHCKICDGYGHFAKTCPKAKKGSSSKKSSDRTDSKAKSKYDPDQIVTLARRVANKGMTPQEAADRIGVNVAMWYYLRNKYAKDAVAKAPVDEKPLITPDEIREQVIDLQNSGLTSLQI